ncbi:MAG TPA: hypothetical protein VN238_11595, partial [Solirubrobacteraceae bacterium]|nr:hypothetical protein [Solirubrobacteraceae bacterium]
MSEDVKALGELAAEGAGGFAGLVRDTHRAIADRAFGPTGPASAPVRVVHDGVSALVYGAVRAGDADGLRADGRARHLERRHRGLLLGARAL